MATVSPIAVKNFVNEHNRSLEKDRKISSWFLTETLVVDFGDYVGRPSSLITLQKEYITRFLENGWTIDAVMHTSETGRWTTYRKTNSLVGTSSYGSTSESGGTSTSTTDNGNSQSTRNSSTESNSESDSDSSSKSSSNSKRTTDTVDSSTNTDNKTSSQSTSTSEDENSTRDYSQDTVRTDTSNQTSSSNSSSSGSTVSSSESTNESHVESTQDYSYDGSTQSSSASSSSNGGSGSSSHSSSDNASHTESHSVSKQDNNGGSTSDASNTSNSQSQSVSSTDSNTNYNETQTFSEEENDSKTASTVVTSQSDETQQSDSTGETTVTEYSKSESSQESDSNSKSTSTTTDDTSGSTSNTGSSESITSNSTTKSESGSTSNAGAEESDGDAYWAAVQRVRMIRRRMQPELVLQDMISSYVRQFNDGVANEDARFNELVTLYGVVLNRNETEGNALISSALDVTGLFDRMYGAINLSVTAANNRAMQFGREAIDGSVVEIKLKFEAQISKTRSQMVGNGTYNGTVWPTVEAGILRQMEAAIAEAKRGGYKDAIDADAKVLSAKGDVMAQLVNAKNAIAAAIDQRKLNVIGIRNNIVTSMINFIGSRQDAFPQIQEISQLASQIGFTVGAAGNVL